MADMVKTVLSENQLLGTVMLYSTASYPVHGHIFSQLLHCLSYCSMQDIKSHNPSRCFFLPELLLVMTLNRIYSVDLVFELFCSTTLISKVSNENWSFRALHCTTSTFFLLTWLIEPLLRLMLGRNMLGMTWCHWSDTCVGGSREYREINTAIKQILYMISLCHNLWFTGVGLTFSTV